MPALKNSANSPASSSMRTMTERSARQPPPQNRARKQAARPSKLRAPLTAFALLLLYGAAAAWSMWSRGFSYFYGDAEAHLNIARRIFDSRTPGPGQIGTVWLPLPRVLLAIFARYDSLWISGLAGVIPSVLCFALAGALLYAAAQRTQGPAAGLAAALLFATNPNMLYLQSTPMTEPVMAAALAALLLTTLWYRDSQSAWALLAVAAASNAASLTRYEGWFLIPFLTLYIWLTARKKQHAYIFALLASAAPFAWFAHNLYYFGDALAFYSGPYSAHAITNRQVSQGMVYPGSGDWPLAAKYYAFLLRDSLGMPLLIAAATGVVIALFKRIWWPVILLALPGVFYIWSIHSGGTPVFIPELEPYSRYNTRFALVLLPLAAFTAAGIIALLPERTRTAAAFALMLGGSFEHYRSGLPISWEEARIGSQTRREWTAEAAAYLKENYQPGSGIVFWFGDVVPALRSAGIPLREGLYQDNGPQWDPSLFQREAWALTQEGDAVDQALRRSPGPYVIAKRIEVKGAPAILIYRRSP